MADNQEKAGKKEMAEKTEKTKGSKGEKIKPQGKKKKIKVLVIIASVLFALAVIAAGVMTVMFNLFGGRDAILGFLSSFDPDYKSLSAQEEILKAREDMISSREESLTKNEAALAEAEAQIKAKEGSFEATIADLSEERIAQYEQLGAIFTNMEAEPAAKALSEIGSVTEMAIVIYYMKPESSAKVLNCMDPKLAALITESLLK